MVLMFELLHTFACFIWFWGWAVTASSAVLSMAASLRQLAKHACITDIALTPASTCWAGPVPFVGFSGWRGWSVGGVGWVVVRAGSGTGVFGLVRRVGLSW